MATTNLYKKTVGDIELQSGNGIPDHSAPTGSIYSNIDSGSLYVCNGGSDWKYLQKVCYGEIFYNDSTALSSTTVANTWTENLNQSFNVGNCSGTTPSGSANRGLIIGDGLGGLFDVKMLLSMQYDTTSDLAPDFGLSINNAEPLENHQGRTSVGTTQDYKCITTRFKARFNSGDVVKPVHRTETAGGDYELNHSYVIIKRIGD